MISTYESIARAADYLKSKHIGDFFFDIEARLKESMAEFLLGQKHRNEAGIAYWKFRKAKIK